MNGDKLWELQHHDWRCPSCGAGAAEIRERGHRRLADGPCPEACTCRPEHRSVAEHMAELGFSAAPARPAGRYGT